MLSTMKNEFLSVLIFGPNQNFSDFPSVFTTSVRAVFTFQTTMRNISSLSLTLTEGKNSLLSSTLFVYINIFFSRSILTVPWVELGGSVSITCAKTGYSANVEFLTKPFYGGKKNRITAEILQPDRKSFVTISGEWNGAMIAKWTDGVLYTLHSPRAMPHDSPIC